MEILKDVPLKDKNWFETGGNAKFYCTPENESDFAKAIEFANKNNLKIFVLGEGANILVSDDGFDGLVIHPTLKHLSIIENEKLPIPYISKTGIKTISAGAGVKIEDLINFTLQNNLIGLEEFSGIPGSVGGSVFINIHYIDGFLGDFLVAAQLIKKNTGKLIWVDKNWFEFGYDQSKLQNQEFYIVNAIFALKEVSPSEAAYAKGRSYEIIRHRNRRYPTSNSCGSFFRNFHADEVQVSLNGKKMIFTAYYLDKLGTRGELKIGNAIVSPKHANMIESLPGATSTDIINLAKEMQKLVLEKFGILPQPECILVGFKNYPLIKEK